jgi:5-methylcytosine-specific restriction endonuclease McrA
MFSDLRKHIPANIRNELICRTVCANDPNNQAPGCKGYFCPMWLGYGGTFDEAGFQIDHIVEVKHGGTNELSNLQLLCPSCHAVKTKRCAKQKWDFTSQEIDFGVSHMEIIRSNKRQKK